ncbi:uncharacterized protein LOC126666804 [Mercurialis annua]|uniref:uncharacterized protein LOC126666804 n=1 Tax=Mercurialis annua TaxID=3986 RepID=UPI00215E6C4E|nr:uncharacterized protein LOC126666804 [Mercurialis annua]
MALANNFLLLGLVFAIVLLISSEVSARELSQAVQPQENAQLDSRGYVYGHEHEHEKHHDHHHHHEDYSVCERDHHHHEHHHGKHHEHVCKRHHQHKGDHGHHGGHPN